jgi:hypothetical protein
MPTTMQMLAAVPPSSIPIDDDGAAWQGYLTALADQIEMANAQMVAAYDSMRDIFKSLDIPFLQVSADALGIGYPTAWTKELDQQFAEFNGMGQASVGWLREAASGNRAVFLQSDRWGLEQKDNDEFTIQLDAKTHLPITVPTGPQGLHGTLGVPVYLIVAGVAAAVALAGGYLYIIYKVIMMWRDIILGIIDYQRAKLAYDCLKQHPTAPNECHKTNQAMIDLTKAVNAGREPAAPNPFNAPAKAFGELATTLLWVALGGAGIYLGVKLIPPLVEDMRAKKSHA